MSSDPEPPRVSPWRRLLPASVILVALAAALGIAAYLGQAWRTAGRLEAAIAALDERETGWRLEDLDAARPDPPPVENSALVIERMAGALPKGYSAEALDEKLQGVAPAARLDDGRRRLLADDLAAIEPALAEGRRMAAMPQGRHAIDYSSGPLLLRLPRLDDVRLAAALLRLDAWISAEKSDPKQALLSCRAALNAARSVADEPFLHVQLARCSEVGRTLAAVERVLALTEPADADLAELQALVAREERHPTARVCARGACGELHAAFLWLEQNPPTAQGFKDLFNMKDGFDDWRDNVFGVSVADLRHQHAVTLELLADFVEIPRLPPHEQPAAETAYGGKYRRAADRHRFVGLLMPGAAGLNAPCRRKLGKARAMLALLAVERYRLRHGGWPARLADVPKDLLDDVPLDPYDGKPVRYRRTADGVVVYVVGADGKDDGGAVERPASGGAPADWGYRLWDVNKRRQTTYLAPLGK
jgi:hypothetical protein